MNNKDRMMTIALPERTLSAKWWLSGKRCQRTGSLSRHCERVPGAIAISRKSYSTAIENGETYDVVIAGDSMIGMILACAIG